MHDFQQVKRESLKCVKEKDIPELLKIGKQYLYVLDLGDDHLHENDAAHRISRAISDPALKFTEPKVGRINIIAKQAGLLKINVDALLKVNKMENIIVATLKNNFPCKKGEIIAGTRIIPLTIPTKNIEALEALAKETGNIVSVKPYRSFNVGAVVTGSEVYNGLITDDFGPSIGKKLIDAGCTLAKKIIVPDKEKEISDAILELKTLGCDIIITTGGLSVDPDDVTRQGVINAGADVTFYGSPVLPGAMLMISHFGAIPIISLPVCFITTRRFLTLFFQEFWQAKK